MAVGHGTHENDRVEIDVWVEVGDSENPEHRRSQGPRSPAACNHGFRLEHSLERTVRVVQQERRAEHSEERDEPRHPVHEHAETRHARRDEERVANDAYGDDGEDMLLEQALAQDVDVLSADRHDEREAKAESGEECGGGEHPFTVKSVRK